MAANLGPIAKCSSCAGIRGMVNRLMTHLLLFEGAVCGGTTMMVVVVGAVGAGTAVVSLLVV